MAARKQIHSYPVVIWTGDYEEVVDSHWHQVVKTSDTSLDVQYVDSATQPIASTTWNTEDDEGARSYAFMRALLKKSR